LFSFDAALRDGVVDLDWKTSSEQNNAFFTIERSGENLAFDSIGFVAGAGDSQEALIYHATDMKPLRGTSYYRLKQTDYDGKYSYSDLVRIENNQSGQYIFQVYPNPGSSAAPVLIRFTSGDEVGQYVFMRVTDVTGRTVYTGMVDFAQDIDLNNLVTGLGKGVYLITIHTANFNGTKKVVVR
jgi:hypothetical protein